MDSGLKRALKLFYLAYLYEWFEAFLKLDLSEIIATEQSGFTNQQLTLYETVVLSLQKNFDC